MHKIVVLNLAERASHGGPVAGVVSALNVKHSQVSGVDIATYDLTHFVTSTSRGVNISDGPELVKIATACSEAKKIYLCTHGHVDDTDQAFAGEVEAKDGRKFIGTWKDVGELLCKLFTSDTAHYNVALVMCYGARTTQYRARDLDHNGRIPHDLIRTSFAYKLFKYLCMKSRNIRMTARTGAVMFNDTTGHSMVEQEAAIDIALDKEEFLRQPQITAAIEAWKARRDSFKQIPAGPKQDKAVMKWFDVDQKFKRDPTARTKWFSSMEKEGKSYHQAVARKREFEAQKRKVADLAKFGKIIYSWTSGTLTVTNKYGCAETGLDHGEVLYEGALF